MKHVKREFALGIFFSLMATVIYPQEDIFDVSFNVLFPQNWYTRALQSYIQVWGDLDGLIANPDLSLEQQFMFVDASIGKMTYVCSYLDRITQEDAALINADDYRYLQRILYKIALRCEKLTGRRYDDRLSCLVDLVHKTKQTLISLFESNNASSGAEH